MALDLVLGFHALFGGRTSEFKWVWASGEEGGTEGNIIRLFLRMLLPPLHQQMS